jgi:FixJ family two-component response regulator
MTGFELLQNLAARGLHVPTIVCTGDDTAEMRARYDAASSVVYLQKPVATGRLIDAIGQAVRSRSTSH